jgi:hypothetical protein
MVPFNRLDRGEIVPSPKETSSRGRRVIPAVFFVVILAAVLILFGKHCLPPGLLSRGMSGHLMNAVAVPGPGGGHRLWILSDGSFHYILRKQTPSMTSVANKCRFCSTWTYVYDPASKTLLAKFKTDYKTIILQSWMAYSNGKMWVATDAYDENEPRLLIYSEEPPGLVEETPSIIKRYPELSSGLIKVRLASDPDRLILDTKDGRVGLVLSLAEEKIYANESEFRKATAAGDEEQVTFFALGREDSGPRKKLFRLMGPKGRVKDGSLEYFLRDPQQLLSSAQATAAPAGPGCVYIEGLIFSQDFGGCLILHQDAAGRTANRLLTCIDAGGNEKWTAGPTGLFKEMRVDLDQNPLSNIFFMKDKLDVSRSGNLVLLQQKGVGIIGFDFATGQKLWEIKL